MTANRRLSYSFPMSTVVEIPDEQQAQLQKLALRRGEKDLSKLLREAIELYLDSESRREARIQDALSVIGTLDDDSADALEESVRRIRANWR